MDSSMSRRQALHAAAAAGIGAPLLAACGSSGGPAATDTASASASTDTASSGALAVTSDVPVGSGTVLKAQKVVVTQPTSGEFRCFSAICTHQGCVVSNVSSTINCMCHGSQFAITDGSVVSGPATAPLPAQRITVSGDQITLG